MAGVTVSTDKPIPVWQKAAVLVYAAGWAVFVGLDWRRFVADFWPVDRSYVGPNLVASVVQYTLLAITFVLVWPPTRRRIHRFVDAKADSIKQHVSAEHARTHQMRVDAEAELHRKLDHIITHHPDIPPLP